MPLPRISHSTSCFGFFHAPVVSKYLRKKCFPWLTPKGVSLLEPIFEHLTIAFRLNITLNIIGTKVFLALKISTHLANPLDILSESVPDYVLFCIFLASGQFIDVCDEKSIAYPFWTIFLSGYPFHPYYVHHPCQYYGYLYGVTLQHTSIW